MLVINLFLNGIHQAANLFAMHWFEPLIQFTPAGHPNRYFIELDIAQLAGTATALEISS